NAAGTLTLSSPITINRDMTVSTGTIAQGSNTITLLRNAKVDATLTATSGNGLIFQGTGSQQLTRSSIGTGTLGIVTIDNINGIVIPDGSGYDFVINTSLRLKQGVLDIGSSLLSLGASANIVEVNTFSATNMIQTNSSFTDNGVKKSFNANVTTDFTFPIGQLKYTPVVFNFSSPGNTTGTTASNIIVRPANERHPSIVEDTESPAPQITDINNVLQYHWIINANTSTNFSSSMTMYYSQSDVAFQSPYTEADYIAARILSDANPSAAINKFSTAEVNETNNTITIPFAGVTDAGISGEYFAGVDPAIPSNIPIFTTTRNGDVNEGGVGGVYDILVPGGGAPTGAILIVDTGDVLTLNISNVSLYSTEIKSGATLIVNGTIGHRLGIVTGTGNIRLTSNTTSAVLPAGYYNDFFTCTGGGIEYFGTGSYSIMNGITTVKSMLLDGSGSRNLSTNDILVCDDLTVNGPTLGNANNINVTVQDDLFLTGGTINKGTTASTLTVNGDFNQTAGTFNGQTAGATTIGSAFILNGGTFNVGSATSQVNFKGDANRLSGTFNGGSGSSKVSFNGTAGQNLTGSFTGANQFFNLEINNGSGLVTAGDVDVSNTLFLTNGFITTGTTNFTLSSTAVVSPTIGKVNSNISGKLKKVMNTGTSFTFPISKAGYWRNMYVSNTTGTATTWDAEYFNSPPTTEPQVDNFTPTNSSILTISRGEYWAISDGFVATTGRTATLGLMWGVQSDVSTVKAERESMQVMAWNDGISSWDNFGGASWSSGHTQSNGYFTATSSTSFSRRIVALGSTEIANPLPIKLHSFTGKTIDGVNVLSWITDSELNNDYFEIERSSDGEHFEFVASMPGHLTTTTRHEYSLDDIDPLIGKNYYRLKQIDLDGKYSYAKNLVLLTIEESDITLSFQLYPNPTETNNINLKIRKDNDLPVQVRIMDLNGREVITKMVEANFSDDVKLITNKELSAGLYLIELSQGHRREVKRLIIN
ncbi:MAG: T9SS type A sorting domain-containing protein, partial [Chryseolinea sp.]